MTCGHILIHYDRRCHKRHCKTIIGPVKHINDTCASCHPTHVMMEIKIRHDDLRAKLMDKLRRSTSKVEVAELQRALAEEQDCRSKELRAADRIRWNGVVDWGIGSELRLECED